MKNIYSTTLVGAALMLAGSAQGQKALSHAIRYTTLQPAHSIEEVRGGTPANDLCDGATVQSLTIGTDLVISGDNTGAQDTEGFGFNTTWEAFELSDCANLTVSYCGTPSVFGNVGLGLGDCPLTAVVQPAGTDDCGDGNFIITYNDVPAGTWYIPVLEDTSATGAYTITVVSSACAPPPPAPANDDCSGVISLPVNDWCNFQYFTSAGGTETFAADSCDGFLGSADDDVWFSFVATATNITVAAQGNEDGDGNNQTGYDVVMELFTTCGTGSPLDCSDITLSGELEQIDGSNLTVGTTYYVRVFDWYTGNWPDHTFGICVSTSSDIGIGMEEHTVNAFSIYPNPGTGVFNLQYSGKSGLANIEVMDVTGRIVRNEQAQVSNGTIHSLDLTGVSTGNYNVRLTVGGVRTEQRLMVK